VVVRNYAVGIYKTAKTPWRCKDCGGLVATVGCLVCDLRQKINRKQTRHFVRRTVEEARRAAAREATTPPRGHAEQTEPGGVQGELPSVVHRAPAVNTAVKGKKKKREETMKIDCVGHIKTLKLKRELQLPRWQILGVLETLFNFAMVNADDGGVGRYSNDEIALYMEYFEDADKLVAALETSGFLEPCEENRLRIHDWEEHAPKFLKDRLDKRAKRKNDTQGQTSTDCDTPRQDAASSEESEEIGLIKEESIEGQPLASVSLNANPVSVQPDFEPSDELLLELVTNWNDMAAKNPKRVKVRRSKQITPKLRRQVSQLPDDWFAKYKTALTCFPLACFDYDGAFRCHFDWFVQPDKKNRVVVNNILDGVYDWLPEDGRAAREKALVERQNAARRKTAAAEKESSAVYAQIAAMKREGKGATAECEKLRIKYKELIGG